MDDIFTSDLWTDSMPTQLSCNASELKPYDGFLQPKSSDRIPTNGNKLKHRYPQILLPDPKTMVSPKASSDTTEHHATQVKETKSNGPNSLKSPSDSCALSMPNISDFVTLSSNSNPNHRIENIVCSAYLGCRLDLKWIAMHAKNSEYNPRRYPAVIMRIRSPKTTALIYSSGRLICTGANKEDQSRIATRKFARIIQKLGFEAKFMNFRIQNLVGSSDVPFSVHLEALSIAHQSSVTYEPELFPGAIYHMKKPKTLVLIFNSGKIIITGTKQRSDIAKTFENIYPIIERFKEKKT